jgi:hypothetical protein
MNKSGEKEYVYKERKTERKKKEEGKGLDNVHVIN